MTKQLNTLASTDRKDRKKKYYRKKYQTFIPKLIQILNSEQDNGVHWRRDDHGFVVHDEDKFYNHVLPKYFPKLTIDKFTNELIVQFFFQIEYQDGLKSYRNKDFDRKNPGKKIFCKWQEDNYRKKTKGTQIRVPSQNKDPESIFCENIPQKKQKPINQQQRVNIIDKECTVQKIFVLQKQQNLDLIIARYNHEYEILCAETLFYKEIRRNSELRFEDVSAFIARKSNVFQGYFCQKLQDYKMKKLQKLIQNARSLVMQKLPFNIYLQKQYSLKISHQYISQEIIETEPKSNFSKDAFELDHSNHPVDFNEFFRYDWSNFEIMSFNNCQLKSSDWKTIAANAMKMLPNLKHLYLGNNNNEIEIVRENDLISFEKITKFTFNNNKLNSVSQQEIQNFEDNNDHREIIIEMY